MSVQVNVLEAKTQLSRLLDRALAGEEIVIARAGRPLVRLVPIVGQPRELGALVGKGWVADDFDEPLDEAFLVTADRGSPLR